MNKILTVMATLVAMVAGAMSYHFFLAEPSKEQLADKGLFLFDQPRALSPFTLTDQNGQVFDQSSLSDKHTLMFFGYTYCPDICPNTLALLNKFHKGLTPELKQSTQVIMVSVDPDRDTTEQLKNYIEFFNPEFDAVTGDLQALYDFSRELNIVFAHIKETPEDTNYLVDHSGSIVLLNGDGHYSGFFRSPHTVDKLLETYQRYREMI